MGRRPSLFALARQLALAVFTVPVLAQPPAAAPAPTPSAATTTAKPTAAARAETLRVAKERLEQPDEAAVRRALAMLVEQGGDPAAQLIAARLRRGLPPQLIEASIDALVLLGQPSAAPALLELMQHARAPVRRRAAEALGALGIRGPQSALLYALDDPNPEVRAAAAQSLTVVGNARALPALLAAFDRGERATVDAIGNLATARDIPTLMLRAPHGEVAGIAPALRVIMKRAKAPLDAKLKLVRALESVDSQSARLLLSEWHDAFKTDAPAPLRSALTAAMAKVKDAELRELEARNKTTGAKP